jgi:Flp pilus assembly protein TadD
VRCKPHYAEAHVNLGELLAEEGQVAEARLHLRHAVDLLPQDRRARELLEQIEKKRGMPRAGRSRARNRHWTE